MLYTRGVNHDLRYGGDTDPHRFAPLLERHVEEAVSSNWIRDSDSVFRNPRRVRLCDASAAGRVLQSNHARRTGAIPIVPIRDDVEERASRTFESRRSSSRLYPSAAGSLRLGYFIVASRRKTGCSHIRQLHLTAISPGGSRAQQIVPAIQRSGRVLYRLYCRSTS
jgi:hypothetical protein